MNLGLRGIVDEQLRDEVDSIGGKGPCLLHLRDKPGGIGRVLPQVMCRVTEDLTAENMRELGTACRTFDTTRVAVRLSVLGDWGGMVDVTPPMEVVTLSGLKGSLMAYLKSVRGEWSTMFNYASREGVDGMTHEDVAWLLSPYIEGYREDITVTEHPNQRGVRLVDTVLAGGGHANKIGFDFKGREAVGKTGEDGGAFLDLGVAECYLSALDASDWVRGTRAFNEDMAIQTELVRRGGRIGGRVYVSQVRAFAPVKYADFDVPKASSSCRFFGVVPDETYPLVSVMNRSSFEGPPPGTAEQDFVGYLRRITPKLKFEYPDQMVGYITPGNKSAALTHQHTRFVQMCLARGGFSLLGHTASSGKFGRHSAIRVRMNGRDCNLEFIA